MLTCRGIAHDGTPRRMRTWERSLPGSSIGHAKGVRSLGFSQGRVNADADSTKA